MGCGHGLFQYAVIAVPAVTLAESWLEPRSVPSSLHASVLAVAS
jgi:hypothetical protein